MTDFGRPSDDVGVVIAVGWDRADQLRAWFTEVTEAGRVDLRVSVDNDENKLSIFVCRGMPRPWSQIWETEVRHAS